MPLLSPHRPPLGRLAPSPTGRFHWGNLATSLLADAQMRALGGSLALRIEDLDTPRVVPGAAEAIIADLTLLGIGWRIGPDQAGCDPRDYAQSLRSAHYARALQHLATVGRAYPCTCSRRDIEEALSAPHGRPAGREYPGTCSIPDRAAQDMRLHQPHAWRFRARGLQVVHDLGCGTHTWALESLGDFVIARRDGLTAYQLAVVVDDHAMGVTHVLRGRDLLDSAPRQQALFEALGWIPPAFTHVPLWVDPAGQRLSKRDRSLGLDGMTAVGWTPDLLRGALATLLGWTPALHRLRPEEFAAMWNPEPFAAPALALPEAFVAGPVAFARSATLRASVLPLP